MRIAMFLILVMTAGFTEEIASPKPLSASERIKSGDSDFVEKCLNTWVSHRMIQNPHCIYGCSKPFERSDKINILCKYETCANKDDVAAALTAAALEIVELLRHECPIQKAQVEVSYSGKVAQLDLLLDECEVLAIEKNKTKMISSENILALRSSLMNRQAIDELFSIPPPIIMITEAPGNGAPDDQPIANESNEIRPYRSTDSAGTFNGTIAPLLGFGASPNLYIGPRGGQYYINKNGNKTYIKH